MDDVSLPKGKSDVTRLIHLLLSTDCLKLTVCGAATIEKYAKECLPANLRLSGPCVELLIECCSGKPWPSRPTLGGHSPYHSAQ